MIGENILNLRKLHKFTQEDVAEKVGVSRPLDDIVNSESDMMEEMGPKGKYIFGTAKIDEKGCIQIPEKARKMFHLSKGTELIVLGDITQGLALIDANQFFGHLDMLRKQAEQEI